ncbi:SDR family NAD(P)-dependent oxidoreductase [Halosimplex amylolyticum]|uniref:SDR family NAD(P)-dependent oxidoreductase n=1 Tax=Halosimplex amylolyticum TaxID=3396616 RepID=UPI003F55FFA2
MGSPTYDFEDETVVITGASSGIGRATALAFADAGATVLNADVRAEPKDVDASTPTHEAIRDRGGTAEFLETDVTDPAEVEAVVEHGREYGGVDVMINNAAITLGKPMREVTPAELDRLHAVNVRGVFFGCQAAAVDMLDRDDPGVVLNTASISSDLAQGGSVQYEATKGAVKMITRGAALEFADDGIRVNAVAPGQIATEIVDGWTEGAEEVAETDEGIKPVPLGRAGRPADVAAAFLWLASDAAAYTTGELLHVDGGWQVC